MHPALAKIVRILAEIEAERLCAEQNEKSPEVATPGPEGFKRTRPVTSEGESQHG